MFVPFGGEVLAALRSLELCEMQGAFRAGCDLLAFGEGHAVPRLARSRKGRRRKDQRKKHAPLAGRTARRLPSPVRRCLVRTA
jgi:hypothetical protein